MTAFRQVSQVFSWFRWLFMPLGLLALVAVGVHAAADVFDDHLLTLVERLDAWADAWLAQSERFAPWVNRIDARERTQIARGLAVTWELLVDLAVALPGLGYDEDDGLRGTLKTLLVRLNQKPTPMRVLRPVLTGVFAVGGAYAVSRLVESTLFVGLVPDVATTDVALVVARVAGGLAMVTVLASHGWRAVVLSLQHADDVCEARKRRAWLAGSWGTLLALPLAVALAAQARALLSFVL